MTEQSHLRREQASACVVEKVPHPDVVFRDILPGLSFSLRNRQVHIRRHALGKALGQADFSPLPSVPFRTILQSLLQRGEWKIQQHGEGQLVLKKIIEHVR